MSHPFYNPYVPGNQSSTQGSYGLPSMQAERNPGTGSPHFGPGSSSSAASSAPPGGMIPSLLTQSVNYRPEQSRAKIDKDIERSVDLHISRAREEVTFVGKPDHRPMSQSTRFTNTQEILSSGTGTTSYLMSTTSASAGRRHSDVESGSGSSDWLPCYKRSTADDSSKFYSPPASTNYTSSERERDVPATPGLGDFDYRVSDKPGAPTETSRPKYNSEAATDILLQFGLEKKDLDYLIAYPEDQMTPDNLPFILRQIRTQKTERAERTERTVIPPKPYPQPQPIRGVSGMEGFRGSGGSSAVLQPTKVIDYGHTGNYAGGTLDEIGRTSGGSGNMLLVNTNNISSHTPEPPQKDTAEVKSSALGSSFGQGGAVSNSSYNSILRSAVTQCIDPAQRLKTQPNQTYQSIHSSSSLSRKDKDGGFRHEESSKARPLKKTHADHKSASKTQPSSSLFRSVHPNRPGLVVIGTSEATGTKNQSATQGKGSTVAKQMEKQQQPMQMPKKQAPKQPVTQMGKALWPPVVSATQPSSLLSIPTYPSRTVQPSGFSPHSTSTPSASLQPARSLKNFLQSPTQHPAKLPDTKTLPTPAMMHDYAAATPGVFPHTCSLCFKEFTNMKDWISHQNTSLHLESCRVLRTKYPQWNGEIVLEPSAARKDAKPSSSASAQTSQQRHKKTSHGGRSRSHSEGRREKRSRSLSSHSSRYTRSRTRSRSPRYDHDWSHSRSHERQRRRDDRWSSPTRSLERRSSLPRRSEERWSSPRRSRERLPSPRRRDERWSSPGWSEERWSSPRRSPERLSSPRRDDERWLSPKRRDDLWYSRRPSSSESSPQRRLSSASRLSKKQFGKSDVQSLSTLVKTLTPALLNELAKKTKGGKRLNLYPSAVRKSPCSAAPPSVKKKMMVMTSTKALPPLPKSDVSASPKTKLFKPSPPTMVRLEGVVNSLSHGDVVAAMEQFGKTKSVVLFRKKLEALVCFEKEEDAKKLKSLKSIDLKGIVVYVVTQKNLQLKKAPLKKPVLSGVSTSQTTKTTKTTTSSRTVLLPTPCKVSQNSSGAKTKQIQQAPASASIAVSNDFAVSQELLTIGDMIIKHLNQNKIKCIRKKTCQLTQFLDCGKKHMVISHLPKYEDGCYTEEDIANVLIPYGFIYKHENIFVFPEACMAFVVMPTVQEAHEIMKLTVSDSIMFKGSRLLPHVIHDNVLKSPLMFYRYLMSLFLMRSNEDRGERIIYIKNISPSEARDLRETLRTIDSVINYLPLLNKVYVEFDSSRDADRIGVWHSLLKHAPGYKVYRLKTTDGLSTALSPKLAANALPDGKDVVPGATIPSVKFGVPQGSIAPFWVTMATGPFVFPTVSPWFIIPEHLTVKGDVDIEKANSRSTMFPTLMLTGLPEGGYRQEDVARLVWPYFPKQTLHSLYYNVIVLTLQRRAFVHFSDWTSCCDFVRDHTRKPVSVRGCVLKIHFVLEYMYPESKEELMYKSLMKWSNSRVPDPQSLEERLLCVEISETRVELVKTVMKMVASIAKFVSFLPLANRICVEMADSSGVTKVVEKYNSYLLTSISASQGQNRCRVQGVESVKSLKQRLEDCTEIILNLGLDAISAEAPPATQPPPPKPSDNGQQPVVQTSVRASAKPAACDESITCEHGEKLGTEIVLDSTACPQSNEEQLVKMVEDGSPTTTDDAASGATHTHLVTSEEPTTELLQIDQEPFGAKEGQEDFSDDVLASDAYIFDEPDFDMSDFVTVDEISDDVEETSPDLHSSSSSKQSSTGKKVKQSSGTSYAPKQTSNRSSTRSSTRFLKDSKSSASFSSKSTKDYVRRSSSSISTSVSPKTTKDSSKSTKSPASSYASSSFLSLETSPSSCHKAQRSKTKSPLKGSHASSSSCGIRLSSTARERVKMLSAAVSVERLPVSQRQAAKESVVAKSDHKVSAEGIAAKTVESETKIEKSSEMHPPAQGQRFGLSQDQNVETGLKDTALKDPEKGKEKKEEEEEEEDDDGGEKYQRLDSFDGRTDKQQDEGNQAGSSDTKSPEPEKCLVLDSVNDDGKDDTEEEKVSEMVDSIEEELVQEAAATERTDRRRSGRGKKEDKMTLNLTEASEKADEDEEASYEILDSVEDETATEEPAVMTRSTRGRRGRTTKKDQTKKEDTPTRRRRTPARESQEKTPKMEKEASSKENSPTKKSDITVREEIDEDATYEILDSVEDEVLKDDRPPTGGKRKRGRPKKEVRTTRKDTVTLKGDKEADDEEKVSYQILEAVKDEMVEDHPPTEESHKNEEEEPLYQIVDSVEDDRVQEELMTTEVSKDETCPKEEAPTCSTIVLEASEKVVAEDLESGNDPSAAEESGVDKKERSPKIDIKKEDTSTTKSQGDAATPAEEKNQQSSSKSDTIAVKSALLNLDEVRDEEDDYPKDTAEAEELRERQAAAEEKQLAKEQERKTREKDGREQRSRSGRWKAKERGKEQEVVGSTELVTLDEVGADEAREETVAQCREPDVEIRAGELQGLVTLDEIADAEEGEVEQSTLEPRPPIKEDHTVETLEEAGDDEEGNLDEAEKTSRPVKRRINDDTEESTTFVTVDEVGEVEEEGKKEAPRTRGRPKKRTRKTPVRKSTRGKKVVAEEQPESGSDAPPPTSPDASSSLDKDPSTLSSDSQQEIQKALLEGAGHSDIDAASAGQDLQPEPPENQRLEGEEAIEGRCRADVEVPSKRKREPVGPEAKRSRSLSPSVSIKLPPFSPSNPLGPEFLVPKLGYFCNLCHVFCLHESSAKDAHCSSQTHYDNLQNHYEKLQPEPSKGSTENSQASFSD